MMRPQTIILLAICCGLVSSCASAPVETANGEGGGRQLQSALATKVIDSTHESIRGVSTAMLAALASAFTQTNLQLAIEAFKLLSEELKAPIPAPAAPAQPTAQIIQLPDNGPSSGIKLATDTPVEVGSPVNVDTPVQQDNQQRVNGDVIGSSSSKQHPLLSKWQQYHHDGHK